MIKSWIESLPLSRRKRVKAKLNARLLYLQALPRLRMPDARMLRGDCDGLFEIRLGVANVQYRPLACYGPGRSEVTLLAGAIEMNERLMPPSICSTALSRKALLMADNSRRYVCQHDFS